MRGVTTTRKSIPGKNNTELEIIILAAGCSKKTYGSRSLFKMANGRTLIEHQLDSCVHSYKAEYTVGVGFEADRVINILPPHVKIIENERYDSTNVIRTLNLCLRITRKPNVLIIYGDILFGHDVISNITDGPSKIIVSDKVAKNKIGINVSGGQITYFHYGGNPKWGEIVYLTGKELSLCGEFCRDMNNHMKSGCEMLNAILEADGELIPHKTEGQIIEVNSIKDMN